MQRRETGEIFADLADLLDTVSDTQEIGSGAQVATITTRMDLLSQQVAALGLLKVEAEAKKDGRDIASLAEIDLRLVEIGQLSSQLDRAIAKGEGPEVPMPKGWGGDLAAHLSWKKSVEDLEANREQRQQLEVEKGDLSRDRPVAQLLDKVDRIERRLAELQADLVDAQAWRYFYLLMTTRAPVRTQYKDEGIWQSGPSALGVFVFNGPDQLQGIPRNGLDPVEVHIHFRRGSKQINRAHIKSGWEYTVLDNGDGPVKWYADSALASCKATIAQDEII